MANFRISFLILIVVTLHLALVESVLSWQKKTSLPSRRSDMACNLYGSTVYISGGCAGDQVYYANDSACSDISNRLDVYFLDSDTWASLPNLPRPRYRHVTVQVDKKLYLFGGRDATDTIIQEIDIYDITDKQWTTPTTKFTQATSDFAGYEISGKRIVLFGGYDQGYTPLGDTHIFHTDTITFEYSVAQMNLPRGDICSVVANGIGYTYGGYQSDFCSPVSSLETFDSLNNTWTNAPVFGGGVTGGDGACLQKDGKFVAIGGEQKDNTCHSSPVKVVETYDYTTDFWTNETSFSLPEGRFRFCGASYQNTLYIFGGQGPLQVKAGLYYHVIVADVYALQEPPMPTPTSSASVLKTYSMIFMTIMIVIFLTI